MNHLPMHIAISIHAAREGGDDLNEENHGETYDFNPRRP